MDAKNFFEEAHRMCKNRDSCEGCPVRHNNDYCIFYLSPSNQKAEETDRIVQFIEKWSQKHPRKTRLMDFLRKYPNAPIGEDGTPNFTPRSLGYCGNIAGCYACKKGEGKPATWCWEQEVEEDETD